MKIKDITRAIEEIAPPAFAQEWDNIGLLYGDPETETASVVICLDITEDVLKKAVSMNAGLCVSHHPLIFDPLRRFDNLDPSARLILSMISTRTAFYAAHTNLDVCKGGVNDSLAAACGFDPVNDSDEIMPFRICKAWYEDTLFRAYTRITDRLKIPGCLVNFDKDRQIKKVVVSGGSFGSDRIMQIVEAGADCVITGEIKYHDMLRLSGYGIAVFAAGHAASERVVLKPLAARIAEILPGLSIAVHEGLDYNRVVS